MGARNPRKAEEKIKDITQTKEAKGTLSFVQLDVDNDSSILAAVEEIKQDFGRIDVLVNNAGICPERGQQQWPTREHLRATFETNVYSPAILTEACIPLLKASSNPKVINVTSGLGSISTFDNDLDPSSILHAFRDARFPAYRMSKSALNMLSAYQQHQLTEFGIKVWAYCPGWVVTDLTDDREVREGIEACESSETSAEGILDIVDGKRDGEAGKFITKRGGGYSW